MQLRTFLAASVIGLSLACVAGFASGQQIYKWKDAGGVTHYSQTPPPKGTDYTKVHLLGAPDVSSNPSTPANGNQANAAPDARASSRGPVANGSQPDTPANRAALCKQLSSNIALLESKQTLATNGSSGKTVLSDGAREQQLARARAQQARYCSSRGS